LRAFKISAYNSEKLSFKGDGEAGCRGMGLYVVPATWEAEEKGSLEYSSSRPD
jgi:hypothetical protein